MKTLEIVGGLANRATLVVKEALSVDMFLLERVTEQSQGTEKQIRFSNRPWPGIKLWESFAGELPECVALIMSPDNLFEVEVVVGKLCGAQPAGDIWWVAPAASREATATLQLLATPGALAVIFH